MGQTVDFRLQLTALGLEYVVAHGVVEGRGLVVAAPALEHLDLALKADAGAVVRDGDGGGEEADDLLLRGLALARGATAVFRDPPGDAGLPEAVPAGQGHDAVAPLGLEWGEAYAARAAFLGEGGGGGGRGGGGGGQEGCHPPPAQISLTYIFY